MKHERIGNVVFCVSRCKSCESLFIHGPDEQEEYCDECKKAPAETEFEKNALTVLEEKTLDAKIFAGSFYDCRGGWARQKEYYPSHGPRQYDQNDRSLILRINTEKKDAPGTDNI